MNLSFHPIVIFEDSWPFPLSHLKDLKWEITSSQIGSHSFDVEISSDSPFEIESDKNFIEFHLTKKNVPFQYDDYPCQIFFSATLDSPHTSSVQINEVFWGIVKTTWSKGLQ
jgi:hypothetical protein